MSDPYQTPQTGEIPVQEIWRRVCADLELQLSPAMYNTWIVSNRLTDFQLLSNTEALGVITSPSAFHATNIKRNLQGIIQDALFRITGKAVQLEYQIGNPIYSPTPRPHATNPFKTASLPQQPSFSQQAFDAASTESPRVEDLFSPQTMQAATVSQAEFVARKTGLRPDYTFKTFAVDTSNEMAHAAATAVSENPGTAYNPLFLYGGVGVGKTHLMHAIGNNIIYKNPQAKIIYCSGEQFTNDIISSIQQKKTLQFKQKYRNIDIFLIDDIQFIAGKNAVQEEFFHTFNAIAQQRGQIVLTSDRPPHEINLLEDRLRSRFEAGLMIDIQQPTFELRTAILLIKAKAQRMTIPMDIAHQIASKVDSARKIEGIITSLRSEVELKGKTISRELVDSIIKVEPTNMKKKLRVKPDDVIKSVANHYHIKQVMVRGQKRLKEVVKARHIAMFLLKEDLNLPYTEIGRWFSNRDHTSAMHACSKIAEQVQTDQQLFDEISAIRMNLVALSK